MKNTKLLELKVNSNCWICEGWTEVKFSYKPGVSDDQPEHDRFVPIYLHLQCDKFEKDLMQPDPEDPSTYISYRMVPPGVQNYYFSIGEKKMVANE